MKQMKTQIKTVLFLLATIFWISCSKDYDDLPQEGENMTTQRMSGNGIMNISYEITTSRSFEADPTLLSDLDLAATNPSNEKQRVTMELMKSGQINMTIESLDFKEKIRIPHKTLPDPSPKIVKTVITGNSASFYDKNDKLLSTEKIPISNQIELVEKINKLGKNISQEDINETIATMQGHKFVANLEEFIANAPSNNIQISERGNNLVTARMPLSKIDPRMSEDVVLLIDRNKNKLVGTRVYSANNKLLQSVLFAYNKGRVKSLKAIRTSESISLPSGSETKMITLSKIENLQFNLNI